MPFKSQAQRAKFGELVAQGKMKQSTFDEWNKATGNAKLPERVGNSTVEAAPQSFGIKPKTISELRMIANKKLGK